MRRRFFNSGGAVEPPIEGPTFEAYDITDYVKQGVSADIPQYVPIGTTIMYHKPSDTLKAFAFTSNMIDAMTDGQGGINSKTYAVNDYEPVGIVLYSRRQIEMSSRLDSSRLCCISLHALVPQEGEVVLRNGVVEYTFASELLNSSFFKDCRRHVITGVAADKAIDINKIPLCSISLDFNNASNYNNRIDYMFSTDREVDTTLSVLDPNDSYRNKVNCIPFSALGFNAYSDKIWSPFETSIDDTHGNYYNPLIKEEEYVIRPMDSAWVLPSEYFSVPYDWDALITSFVDSLQDRFGLYRVDTNFFTLPTINELRMMWARIDIITETELALAEIFSYIPILGSFKGPSVVMPQRSFIYSCDYLSSSERHLCMGYMGRLMALPLGSGVILGVNALVIPFFHLSYTDLG